MTAKTVELKEHTGCSVTNPSFPAILAFNINPAVSMDGWPALVVTIDTKNERRRYAMEANTARTFIEMINRAFEDATDMAMRERGVDDG